MKYFSELAKVSNRVVWICTAIVMYIYIGIHKHSFKNENDNQTSLSKFIWTLKRKNIKYDVTWKILDRGEPFSPISGKCTLCIKEKFHIIFNPTSADLNSRDEIFSNCRHKISKLLNKRNKSYKRKRPGGWLQDQDCDWDIYPSCYDSSALYIIV